MKKPGKANAKTPPTASGKEPGQTKGKRPSRRRVSSQPLAAYVKATTKGPVTRDVIARGKGKSIDFQRLRVINIIRSYLRVSSQRPFDDWQEIRRLVEERLGIPSLHPTPQASERQPKASEPASNLATETMFGSEAGDAPRAISPQLDRLLSKILDNPGQWLATPSEQFGGKKPADLIGTDEEHKVIDLLVAVDQGMF